MAHFSAECEQEVYGRYTALIQNTMKLSVFYSELLVLHTELGAQIGALELSKRFGKGLHEKVGKYIEHTLITLSRPQWEAFLQQTVSDTDSMWNKLAPEDKMGPPKKKGGINGEANGREKTFAGIKKPGKAAPLHAQRLEYFTCHGKLQNDEP